MAHAAAAAHGREHDGAVETLAEDQYERLAFVERAASLIDRRTVSAPSVVFGLTGPWGSGKTSVVNMIVETLTSKDEPWSIAQFTPWAAVDQHSLFSEFFAALSEAFPGAESRTVRERLGRLLQKTSPLVELLPTIGTGAGKLGSIAAERLAPERSWAQLFEAASDAIAKSGRRILIVVDDLDRLHSAELTAVLKVVRLLGRFDGVHYLLAYDDQTVFRTLEAAELRNGDPGWAQNFMEKIVQYPMVLPPLTEAQVFDGLNRSIKAALDAAGYDNPDLDRTQEAGPVIRHLLRTPRAVGRFDAQLRHYLPMLPPAEASADDAILISLVRLAFPLLYAELPYWKTELLTGATADIDFTSSQLVGTPVDFDALLAYAPAGLRLHAKRLLALLFPRTDDGIHSWAQSSDLERCSIANSAYFDRYFSLGVLSEDVSNIEVHHAVEAAGAGRPYRFANLLKDADGSRQQLVLERAASVGPVLDDDDARLRLAVAIAAAEQFLTDERGGMAQPRTVARQWLVSTLGSLSESAPADKVRNLLESWGHEAEQLEILWRVARSQEAATFPWFREVAGGYAVRAADTFLQHLRRGDDADHLRIPLRELRFALDFGGDHVRDQVDRDLAAGSYAAEDVVIRVVALREEDGALEAGVIQPLARLLPAGGGWFERPPMDDLMRPDEGWPSRRAFVRSLKSEPPGNGAVQPD